MRFDGKGLRIFVSIMVLSIYIATSTSLLQAQTSGMTIQNLTPTPGGHDYIQNLGETVNPANGSVSLNITLPTPPGRGLSEPFVIKYDSSSVWQTQAPGINVSTLYVVHPPLLLSPYSGWSNSTPSLSGTFNSNCALDDNGNCNGVYCSSANGFVFKDLLGTQHALPTINLVDPPGYGEPNASGACTGIDTGVVTQATDGAVQAVATIPSAGSGALTIADKDGTVYTFSWSASPGSSSPFAVAPYTIEDKNGNYISVNGTNTDTLGRPYGSYIPFTDTSSNLNVNFSLNTKQLYQGFLYACGGIGETYNSRQFSERKTLTLPNNQIYTFGYDSVYGLLNKIAYPNGGTVSYDWGINPQSDTANYVYFMIEGGGSSPVVNQPYYCNESYDWPAIKKRVVSFDGINPALEQDFTYTTGVTPLNSTVARITTVITKDLIQGTQYTTTYSYAQSPGQWTKPGEAYWVSAPPLVEQTIAVVNSNGTTLNTHSEEWFDLYNKSKEVTVLDDGVSTSEIDNSYEISTGITRLVETDHYDYGQGQRGALLSKSSYSYATFGNSPIFPNYDGSSAGPVIMDQPSQKTIFDGGGNLLASTVYCYDQTIISTMSGIIQHDDKNFPTNYQIRGNLTQELDWVNSVSSPSQTISPSNCGQGTSSNVLSTSLTYDQTGQRTSEVNPRGISTVYNYSDRFRSGTPNGQTNAYVTQISIAGESHQYTYDYQTGHLASGADQNDINAGRFGVVYLYSDPLFRNTETDLADGGKTTYRYNDSGSNPTIITTTLLNSSGAQIVSTVQRDGMGHNIQTQINSDPSGTTVTDTTYTGLGQISSMSNPYRTLSDSTYGSTSYRYDALQRKISATHSPDSSTLNWTYYGAITTTQDEVGNSSQQTYDAAKRLISIIESPSIYAAAGSAYQCSSCPSLSTIYSYDVLGNLLTVNQKGTQGDTPRNRYFTYDSLSRLTNVNNGPEGSVYNFTYDPNGNPWTRTDNRGVVTTYEYDQLDRLIGKSYSGINGNASSIAAATPESHYYYTNFNGSSPANGVGRLVAELTGSPVAPVTETTVQTFDSLGRVQGQIQCITTSGCGGVGYNFSYSYDYVGHTVSSSNGLPNVSNSGNPYITFGYGFDAAGRLSTLSSNWNDASHPPVLFAPSGTSPQYSPAGLASAALGISSSAQLPTFTQQRTYDNRMRVTSETDYLANTASPATGTISISGVEQQASSSSAPSHGSFTISGVEGYTKQCTDNSNQRSNCPVVWDSGTVSVMVGSYKASASYSRTSTLASVAAALVSALNASGSPISATTNGANVVYITGVGVNAFTNYPLSGSSNGDFIVAASGSTMTSGSPGTTVYDAGNITVTIGSNTPVSVSWGNGSTVQSIASSIATQLSNGFTTSIAGATVTLTSKNFGQSQASSIVASVSYDSADFSSSSFSVGTTGMSAGTNGSALYAYSIPSSGYAANSNILQLQDSVIGNWTYTYDTLNRLKSAQAASDPQSGFYPYGSALISWGYDSFGNYLGQSLSGSTSIAISQPSYAYSAGSNQISGISYDADGQQLTDSIGNLLQYDAEGRVTTVNNSTAYLYDAEGRRVAKLARGQGSWSPTNFYLLGLQGETVSELDGSGNWLRTNVYAGSELATYDEAGLHFRFTDWIGTLRAQGSGTGALEETCRSLPYGDSLQCYNGNGTQVSIGQGADGDAHHFTGKKRDVESGLDYFGARFYASVQGRFISPDWSSKPEAIPYSSLVDPQSLNLYSYVRNNPITRLDADGHADEGPGHSKEYSEMLAKKAEADTARAAAANKAGAAQQQNGCNCGTSTHYKTADRAAKVASDKIFPRSEKEHAEYGGRVYRNADGSYSYTTAVTQHDAHTVDIDAGGAEGSRVPTGTTNAGVYHTHPSSPGYAVESFSFADVATAVREHVPMYMEAPSRTVYKVDGTNVKSVYDAPQSTVP